MFAIRVGALDGRHPRAGERVLRRIAMATRPDARLFIDGGDPLRELRIPRPLSTGLTVVAMPRPAALDGGATIGTCRRFKRRNGSPRTAPPAACSDSAPLGIPVTLVALWYAVMAGPPPCPTDGGCSPTPWMPVALGLAMAVPFTIMLHPGVAAILGIGVALAWWQAQRTAMPPWWSLRWALAFAA